VVVELTAIGLSLSCAFYRKNKYLLILSCRIIVGVQIENKLVAWKICGERFRRLSSTNDYTNDCILVYFLRVSFTVTHPTPNASVLYLGSNIQYFYSTLKYKFSKIFRIIFKNIFFLILYNGLLFFVYEQTDILSTLNKIQIDYLLEIMDKLI